MVCLSTKLKISTLTLNNICHLAGHLLDVLVLGDGAVEVFWSIQRQPINVCCEETGENLKTQNSLCISNLSFSYQFQSQMSEKFLSWRINNIQLITNIYIYIYIYPCKIT